MRRALHGLLRRLPGPFPSLAYAPRGPQAAEADRARVLTALADYVRAEYGSLALSVEPDWAEPFSPMPKAADGVAGVRTASMPAA